MDLRHFLSRQSWRSLFHRHAKRAVRSGMGLPPDKDKPSKGQVGAHFGYWLLAIIAILLFQSWWIAHQSVEVIPYSRFLQLVQEHKVESVQVNGQQVTGRLKAPLSDGRTLFSTTSVPPDLADMLQNNGVSFTGVTAGFWDNLLGWPPQSPNWSWCREWCQRHLETDPGYLESATRN